jgi:uncharacterized damage-inducible protein DinB
MTETLAYLEHLTQEALNTEIELNPPGDGSLKRTPAAGVHHFLTHAFHHKGQIVAMCRHLGHPGSWRSDLLWNV